MTSRTIVEAICLLAKIKPLSKPQQQVKQPWGSNCSSGDLWYIMLMNDTVWKWCNVLSEWDDGQDKFPCCQGTQNWALSKRQSLLLIAAFSPLNRIRIGWVCSYKLPWPKWKHTMNPHSAWKPSPATWQILLLHCSEDVTYRDSYCRQKWGDVLNSSINCCFWILPSSEMLNFHEGSSIAHYVYMYVYIICFLKSVRNRAVCLEEWSCFLDCSEDFLYTWLFTTETTATDFSQQQEFP